MREGARRPMWMRPENEARARATRQTRRRLRRPAWVCGCDDSNALWERPRHHRHRNGQGHRSRDATWHRHRHRAATLDLDLALGGPVGDRRRLGLAGTGTALALADAGLRARGGVLAATALHRRVFGRRSSLMRGAGCGRGGRAGAMTAAARGLRGLEVRIRARGLCLGGLRHRLLGSAARRR